MLLLAHSNMAVSETRAMSTSFPRLSMHPLLVTTMSACCRLLLLYGWWEEIEQYDRKKVSATCNVAAGKDHRVSGVGYLVWVGLPGHEFCFFLLYLLFLSPISVRRLYRWHCFTAYQETVLEDNRKGGCTHQATAPEMHIRSNSLERCY